MTFSLILCQFSEVCLAYHPTQLKSFQTYEPTASMHKNTQKYAC